MGKLMKPNLRPIYLVLCVTTLFLATTLSAQSITYQGELNQSGSPADGQFDMEFGLWDSPTGGTQIDSFSVANVSVSNGRFTTELTFDVESFGDSGRWLEIEVDGNTLSPRQAVNHAPYSIQTNGIFVDASLKVGMGTNSPAARLDVFSDTAISGNNTARFTAPVIGPSSSHVHFGVTGDWFIRSAAAEGKVVMQDTGGRIGVGFASPQGKLHVCLLYTSPSPRDLSTSRMPSSA